MPRPFLPVLLLSATLLATACATSASPGEANGGAATEGRGASARAPDPLLDAAIASDTRTPANVVRDAHRHPRETLAFFGVERGDTVVEITPGGGWYAEILAPYLRDGGRYVGAVVDPAAVPEGRQRDYNQKTRAALEAKFAAAPQLYGRASLVGYDPAQATFGPAGSADVVLTFRNVHNWRAASQAEGMFRGFFAVLKPGGVLGVVEHRARADVPANDETGYVGEAQVIALAEAAGFRLDARSEVNANPRDTRDHPNGVWTLPPVGRHDAEDAQKYAAIGESDRMTLRFVKP
ncbi:MAG TPA: methyltransferase [Luteimonas sp.]|nr:methyltransferase [Luteimonas sp.]